MTTVDKLNLAGVLGQLIGFIILARDLWPEYKRAKRKQMILWMVGFSRQVAARFEKGDAKAVFFFYATYKEAFVTALHEVRKHWPDLPLKKPDDIIQEVEFRKFQGPLEENYETWIAAVEATPAFRSMYVERAIFFVIAGYLAQIAALLHSAQVYPFSLISF